MAESHLTTAGPPGNPVHLWIRTDLQVGVRIRADLQSGRILIVPAADPALVWAELMPESALEMALALIGSTHRLMRPAE